MPDTSNGAFVLRISPSGVDRVSEALEDDDIIIGWCRKPELLDPSLDWKEFRESIHQTYYSDEDSYRRSGRAAGNMWRFIRKMEVGDLVVVPHGSTFYVAEIAAEARHEPDLVPEDTAYRRKVKWLNQGEPIPRRFARAALQSRMKTRQTCVDASDILEDIQDALEAVAQSDAPTFERDLRRRLVEQTLDELASGRMNERDFENLVASVLRSFQADDVEVIPRHLDKGVDVVATFSIAETFDIRLAVQAKYYKPEPPVGPEVVDELVDGMEAEDAQVGWVVTTGTYHEAAEHRRDELEASRGLRVELIDGEQLAALLVEGGLRETLLLEESA